MNFNIRIHRNIAGEMCLGWITLILKVVQRTGAGHNEINAYEYLRGTGYINTVYLYFSWLINA